MQPGFCIIHANQLETLAELAIRHSQNEPLAPLEKDIFLVQSNGMADWLKLKQAELTGISAAQDFPMPASFLWQMYRQVLQPELLDAPSPFAKDSMKWRLLKLLPSLLNQEAFARPRHFLAQDAGRTKLFQLAGKLADLFDQYQLYRADWISAWEANKQVGLGQDEAWQAALWRALVESLPEAQQTLSRAHLHEAFLSALRSGATAAGLPRRLYLFGINSLPRQLLDALHAMSRHCQILLLILSPCREYWGDRGISELDSFSASNPLLDAWGAQGRDFLKLLHGYEANELEMAQEINPYAEAAEFTRADSILCQLQQSLLDNQLPPVQPLPEQPGLAFYPAYSRQREVEVLHDTLLTLFAQDPKLQYSDVLVMVPNMDDYVAHIEAVFERYPLDDKRRLAYAISDRSNQDAPLALTLDYLLTLPRQRLALSEVLSLLELPALRASLELAEDDLDQINAWCKAAHIRWALDAPHKQQLLELSEDSADWRAHNTWQAGLDQLLAGYCAGGTDIFNAASVDEVSANNGWLLGQLAELIERLTRLRTQLDASHTPADWGQIFRQLLARFFVAQQDDEHLLLSHYQRALDAWLAHCQCADFNDPLPLAQARLGWLDQLASQGMSQQLSFNGITCCTLMPMRALPFKQVFLLGMNDGDYPHATPQLDFDLMQEDYRPGDRDRRNDDQYLFLEALMSVRDSLHISWVGRDINKDEERPPCTLVAQLRDLVDRSFYTQHTDTNGKPIAASSQITQQLPLAAFGQAYFTEADSSTNNWPADQPARTYASEWFALYQAPTPAALHATAELPTELDARQLSGLLKAPAEVFYRDRLNVLRLDFDKEKENAADDDEPFSASGLTLWQLRHELLGELLAATDTAMEAEHWQKNGALPPGEIAQQLIQTERRSAQSIQRRWQEKLGHATPQKALYVSLPLKLAEHQITLSAKLAPLWQQADCLWLAHVTASDIRNKTGWRFDKLAQGWVLHLIACAQGLAPRSLWVARDKQALLAPLSAPVATQQLQRLLQVYLAAWQQPLAFSPTTPLSKDADTEVAALNGRPLAQWLHTHWPDPDGDEDSRNVTNAWFSELLYRPLSDALAAGAAASVGAKHD